MIMAPGKSLLPNEGKQEEDESSSEDEREVQNLQRPHEEQESPIAWADLPPRFFDSSDFSLDPLFLPQATQNLNANDLLQRRLFEQANYFRQRPGNFGTLGQILPTGYHQDAGQLHSENPILNQSSEAPSIDRELVQDLYRLLQGSTADASGHGSSSRAASAGLPQFQHYQQEPHAYQPMYASLEETKNRIDLSPIYGSGQNYHSILPTVGPVNLREASSMQQELLLHAQNRQLDQQTLLLSQLSNPRLLNLNFDLQPLDRLSSNQSFAAPSAALPPSPPPPPAVVHKPVLRALSAYNFFFRDERDRIVENISGPYDTSQEKKAKLLDGHWHRDRTAKRPHRRTHGKIAFTELSKVISKRWKELDPKVRAFYRDVAADDLVRYHRELDEQKASISQSYEKMPPRDF